MAGIQIVNTLTKGMNLDARKDLQPEGTYREAWNAVRSTKEYRGFGLATEMSNELVAQFEGQIIGYHRLEETNESIVFTSNGAINIFNHDTYKTIEVIRDSDVGCDWGFANCEWIGEGSVISKYMTSGCRELKIYWSSNNEYWVANITALLDKNQRSCYTECDQFRMFVCKGNPRLSLSVTERGGDDLAPGAYYVSARLVDRDGSDTNWSFVEGPVYLESENNKAGETSPNAIRIQVDDLDPSYDKVEVAVFPSVKGVISDVGYVISSQGYNTNGIALDYYSTGQHLDGRTVTYEDVVTKRKTYFKGKNITQKDGRCFLYNTLHERNLNWQRKVNKAELKYVVYAVPAQEAWRYKGLMRDEIYAFGVQFKYCDGTYSPVFPFIGKADPNAGAGCETEDINDAKRTTTICTFEDLIDAYCGSLGAQITPRELENGNGPTVTCGSTSSVIEGDIQDDTSSDCVNQTTTREEIQGNVDNWVSDNDTSNDCIDCGDTAAIDGDLDRTENIATRSIETIQDLFRTDEEVANDCSVGKNATLKEAATALYNEAVKEAEKDEEEFIGYTFSKVGGTTPGGSGLSAGQASGLNLSPSGNVPSSCTPEPIYDENCRLIGYKPAVIAKGEFGGAESTNLYPETKDCEGEPVYGEYAGKNLRFFRVPDAEKERHFISYQTGVESQFEPDNLPTNDTFVFFIGLEVNNLEIPTEKDLPKPLDPAEPYRIVQIERSRHNRTVQQKGFFTHTFRGEVFGKTYAVPKNGVNGPETLDGSIRFGSDGKGRFGFNWSEPIFNFHSPERCISSKVPNASHAKIDGEIYGSGFRYGLWAEGTQPESEDQQQKDHRGARQAINLNHFASRANEQIPISGITYAEAGENAKNPGGIDYPLLNKYREGSVFLQLEELPAGLDRSGRDLFRDNSFIADGLDHAVPVDRGSAWYGALKVRNKGIYGAIESANWVDLGLKARGMETSVSGLVGDSFIQKWSHVRKSLISDKVGDYLNEDIPTTATPEFLGDPEAKKRSVCDPPNRRGYRMREFLGFWDSTTLPESGDKKDPKNMSNAHPTKNYSQAIGDDGPQTDLYYWKTQSTLIHLWVETDVNIRYRETGEEKFGEVYYEKLKSMELDSAFDQTDPENGYLNQFHVEHRQPSEKQKIKKRRTRVFITLVLPAILMGGVASIDTPLNAGLSLFTGPFFIGLWLTLVYNIATNKKLEKAFGFPKCKIDSEGGTEEKGLRGFRDNYCRYDFSFSSINDKNPMFSMPDPYNTCECEDETTNEIPYSNKQIPGSFVDAYLNFRANNYLEIPSEAGSLQALYEVNNRFYAHVTDGIYLIQYSNVTAPTSNGFTFLGSGDLLRDPQKVLAGVPQGYAGTEDPNSGITTPFGRFFVDHEASKLYLYDGSNLTDITGEASGCMNFFREHLQFYGSLDCRDELQNGGTHYALGFDHRFNRLLITKNDGAFSFTISYDIATKTFTSFHNYLPQCYIWDRLNMFSVKNGGIYKHNVKEGDYLTYYGVTYPFAIEVPASAPDKFGFRYESTWLDTEANQLVNGQWLNDRNITFNKAVIYNERQTTGVQRLVQLDRDDVPSTLSKTPGQIKLSIRDRIWSLHQVKGYEGVNDPTYIQQPRVVGKTFPSFTESKEWNTQSLYFGKYAVHYLIFDNFKDTQLVVKRMVTFGSSSDSLITE